MRPVVLLLPLLVSLACGGGSAPAAGAPSPTSSPASSAAPSRTARGSANLILNSEIESAANDINNAYELIERLRPTMLRPRNLSTGAGGDGSTYGIVAYADDVRLGDLEQLKTVMRATVYEIRYINATDATTRWGTGLTNGVIQVRIKR